MAFLPGLIRPVLIIIFPPALNRKMPGRSVWNMPGTGTPFSNKAKVCFCKGRWAPVRRICQWLFCGQWWKTISISSAAGAVIFLSSERLSTPVIPAP